MQKLSLSDLSITDCGKIFHNLSVPELVTQAILRSEGMLTDTGAGCYDR